MVGRRRASSHVGRLEQGPAQRRRALAGEMALAAAFPVGGPDGDVQAAVAHRLLRGGEPAGVTQFGPHDRGGQSTDAIETHQSPTTRLARREPLELVPQRKHKVGQVIDGRQPGLDDLATRRRQLRLGQTLPALRGEQVPTRGLEHEVAEGGDQLLREGEGEHDEVRTLLDLRPADETLHAVRIEVHERRCGDHRDGFRFRAHLQRRSHVRRRTGGDDGRNDGRLEVAGDESGCDIRVVSDSFYSVLIRKSFDPGTQTAKSIVEQIADTLIVEFHHFHNFPVCQSVVKP